MSGGSFRTPRKASSRGQAKGKTASRAAAGRLEIEAKSNGQRGSHARDAQNSSVKDAVQRSGPLADKRGQIEGRVTPASVARAETQTWIASQSGRIGSVPDGHTLVDTFAEGFQAARGSVDPGIELSV